MIVGANLLEAGRDSEAYRYIKHAADAGEIDAMHLMGVLISAGDFPGSTLDALSWLDAAAQVGHTEAAELSAEIRRATAPKSGFIKR